MSLLEKHQYEEFINSIDTFLFDCDGVIWHGNHVLEGVQGLLDILRKKGKKLLFVSNNSTKSRREYLEKFTSLGIEASVDEVFGSAYAAACYVSQIIKLPSDKRVYIVGMNGIKEELAAEGIAYCGADEDNENLSDMSQMSSIKPDLTIGAVLFGFDLNINYKKLSKAFTYIHSNPECHFLATNSDSTFPTGGTVYPGTGALLASLSCALGRQPVVIGKPEKTMLDVIVAKYKLDRTRTCMIGDRLDTDILFGQSGGLKTLLVMTGVTNHKNRIESDIKSDYYLEKISDLAN